MFTKGQKRTRRAKKAEGHKMMTMIKTRKGKYMYGQKQGRENAKGAFGKRLA